MALTKTPIELSSTPSIVDGGNATAITIDSSENVTLAGTLSSGAITSSGNISLGGSDGDNAVLTLAANTGNWVFTNVQANRNLEISDSDGTGTVFTIDTSGDVGILKTAPTSNLHIGASGADAKREIRIDGTNGSSETYGFIIQADGENGRATFKVGQGGGTPAQELMIHPDGGICFNTDTAAANALDDYEEGTWSPQIKAYGGNNAGQSVVSALYTKIGNTVNCVAYINNIDLSAITSGTYIIMDNFPFVATSYGDFSIAYRDGTHATTAIVGGYVQNSTDHAYFVGTNGVEQQQTGSAAITKMMINVTYKTTA
tara:strand:- start:46 stop:990 length:945 start_codon:yes stop_codon:yes gene_type:complete